MSALTGKVALISGTGGGMGRAAALEFAAQGARVVGCDLNADAAEETVALVQDAGGEMVSAAPVDLPEHQAILLSSRPLVDGKLPPDSTVWLRTQHRPTGHLTT